MNIKQITGDNSAYIKMLKLRGDFCTELSCAVGKNTGSDFFFIDTDSIDETRKIMKIIDKFLQGLEKNAVEQEAYNEQ